MNKIVILAHTAHQVKRFLVKNRLRPKDVLYASSPYILEGLGNCVVIYLDGWREHPESHKIDRRVQMAKLRPGLEILEMLDDDLIVEKIAAEQLHAPGLSIVMRQFVALAHERYYYGRGVS